MKLHRTLRKFINKERSRSGKKNGVVRWLFEGYPEHKIKNRKRDVKSGRPHMSEM